MVQILKAAQVFDGWALHRNAAVSVTEGGQIAALHPEGAVWPDAEQVTDLGHGILSPGFVDLQVNGGDGVMVGPDTDADQIARICAVHAQLGATSILPTLITDTAEVTQSVINAGVEAYRRGVPGFAGLHLEGPHLDPARRGAHDASLIRPMTQGDLSVLCDAARALPALMLTVAPESVTTDQIRALQKADAVVSLGHSGCTAEAARAAYDAGARCVTHLYNAMGALQNRAPGLVGAALTTPFVTGIIADGVHVAPECLQIALQMKGPEGLFLVSDAMAIAGTTLDVFHLNGRQIARRNNRLTLEDGTLAGADISLPQSVAYLVSIGGDPARALAMASRIPADVIGATRRGRIVPGARADLVFLSEAFELRTVWQAGVPSPGI